MFYPPIETKAALPVLGASSALSNLLTAAPPSSPAPRASAATGAESPPVIVPTAMTNADAKPGSPAQVVANAPSPTTVAIDSVPAAGQGAVAAPSFFAKHKTEIAVIAAVIGIPMLLLALKAGSDDAKAKNEEAMRRKYAPKKLTSFQDKFLSDHERFEAEYS